MEWVSHALVASCCVVRYLSINWQNVQKNTLVSTLISDLPEGQQSHAALRMQIRCWLSIFDQCIQFKDDRIFMLWQKGSYQVCAGPRQASCSNQGQLRFPFCSVQKNLHQFSCPGLSILGVGTMKRCAPAPSKPWCDLIMDVVETLYLIFLMW